MKTQEKQKAILIHASGQKLRRDYLNHRRDEPMLIDAVEILVPEDVPGSKITSTNFGRIVSNKGEKSLKEMQEEAKKEIKEWENEFGPLQLNFVTEEMLENRNI